MMHVVCNEKIHRVFFSQKSRVVCLDHDLPPKTLAAEAVIGGDVGGCPAVVAALIGAKPLESYAFELWIYRILENLVLKQSGWHNFKRAKEADLLQKKLPHRETLLKEKAIRVLEGLTFRTTKTAVGHAVHVTETWGSPWASGDKKKVTTKVRPAGKKAFAELQQQVNVLLNPKMWARVLKVCGPVVENWFILRIQKIWSKNDVEVYIVHQSQGYGLRVSPKRIRRGNDGVWRIHAKV